MASGIVCLALLLGYALLAFRSIRRHRRRTQGQRIRRAWAWHDPMIELVGYRGIYDRLQPVLHRYRVAMAILEGGDCPPERLLRWTAEGAGMAYGSLFVCWLLAFVSHNMAAASVGTVVAGCIPLLRAKELNDSLVKRKQLIVMEMPVLLSRLLVMVNAGENVRQALARSVETRTSTARDTLYLELRGALAAMQRGESMNIAMEEFGRRCAVPEAKMFATLLLMNVKRGGEELVPALRDMTRQMWEQRKTAARTLGEQASSRLAFPLAMVFLIIVTLVAAPAVMMM